MNATINRGQLRSQQEPLNSNPYGSFPSRDQHYFEQPEVAGYRPVRTSQPDCNFIVQIADSIKVFNLHRNREEGEGVNIPFPQMIADSQFKSGNHRKNLISS